MATKTTFEVGEMRIRILDDGVFITDAGNLFGGSRKMRIRGAMHTVLVETGDDLVLIDAGFGPELPEALAGRYELRREKNLMDHLQEAGHAAEDVTHVILSHLDADHVGWALDPPSFPNATVYVQEDALEEAREMPEGDGRREAIPGVERGIEDGWCELLGGNGEIVPGIRVEVRAGHSAGHQIVWIGTGDDAALYTADLARPRPHKRRGHRSRSRSPQSHRGARRGRVEGRHRDPVPRARRLPRQDPAHRERLQSSPCRGIISCPVCPDKPGSLAGDLPIKEERGLHVPRPSERPCVRYPASRDRVHRHRI